MARLGLTFILLVNRPLNRTLPGGFAPSLIARGRHLNETTSSTRQLFLHASISSTYASNPSTLNIIHYISVMDDYFDVEERLQEALLYKQAHPTATLQFLKRQFKVSKNCIYCQLKGRNSRSTRPSTNQKLD